MLCKSTCFDPVVEGGWKKTCGRGKSSEKKINGRVIRNLRSSEKCCFRVVTKSREGREKRKMGEGISCQKRALRALVPTARETCLLSESSAALFSKVT